MTEPPDAKSGGQERRPAPRRRVLLGGVVVYGNGAYSCECSLRNLSDSGARIAITQEVPLPSRFYLINIRDGLAYDAHVVRRLVGELGVKFDSTIKLSGPIDPSLHYLKRLWLAKVPH